ncbi:RluA family pseudouridine synthase [Mycoplasmopsis lipofaciens]|uniref:RluA family pseudouridine synthase n=1 Tax=Mycoplasmopsis lipofaciens TaxID=114884 RepID=UPI00068C87EB|nr:RluA family pseudouridine synthase [Mycoplasmopsis lipofaciens]
MLEIKNNWLIINIDEFSAGMKILNVIKKVLPNSSLNEIYKKFRKKDIKINNKRVKDFNILVKNGDCVEIYTYKPIKFIENELNEVSLNFTIIYEDSNILIINKPNGFSVHGEKNSIDNQVKKYLNTNSNSLFKPSHVGRLDKETSGIMIYAKNHTSLVELNKKINDFEKIYAFKSDYNGENVFLNIEILKNKETNYLSCKLADQKSQETRIAKTQIFKKNNKYFARILTGKKHQIRLSLQFLGFPIWGDKKYNGIKKDRLYLHCYSLTFQNLNNDLKYLNNKKIISKIPWKEE